MALIPVQPEEIKLGRPLAWTLLSAKGKVLHKAKRVIKDAEMLAQLVSEGLFREEHAAPPVELPPGQMDATSGQTESASKLQLNPGDHLQIQQWNEKNAERHIVKVIGHFAPLSLLVTAPRANGKLLFVREGQIFLARGFVGQDALAYRTRVLKTQLTPFPYLHLAYPDTVQSMRIRKSARARIDLVTAINGPKGNSAGRITDLSVGGAKIISHAAFASRGDEVTVSFRVEPGGIEIYLSLKAIVRTTQHEQMEQAYFATGIEFIDLTEQDRLELMGAVYQNMLGDNL